MDNEKFEVPKWAIDSIARAILPSIREYFSTEKGRCEYEQWKQQEKLKEQNGK